MIRALRKVRRDRRSSHLKKVKSKGPRSYYGFLFISAVRFVSIPTLYVYTARGLYEVLCLNVICFKVGKSSMRFSNKGWCLSFHRIQNTYIMIQPKVKTT